MISILTNVTQRIFHPTSEELAVYNNMGITLIALAAIAIILVSLFNLLVRDYNRVKEGWAGIDVQLKRRHDLIPKLMKTVEAYMSYEKNTLLATVAAREGNLSDVADRAKSEAAAGKEIQNILARAESYPKLKADQSYLSLSTEISHVEDELQMARRYYNGCVRNYNVRLEVFPSSLVARATGFKPVDYFQVDESDRADVNI